MWGIISWLIGLLFGIRRNPIAVAIVQAVGDTMSAIPSGAVARCFMLVKEVADREDLDNTDKFTYVYDAIQTEYPGLKENTIGALIKNTLDAIRKGFL